ncbi:MAG: hypothetical protein WAP03_08800 [Methylorubrum rhodinum]|uniref:hypothetical protein n=1 Tax=Methylorubrum rhodinum TaxID=29428 RepID=UPI003BAF7F1E
MMDFQDLPAWARRRLARRFQRGGNERIVRWMSVPAGRGAAPEREEPILDESPSDNIFTFVPRPEATAFDERPRAAAMG